MYLFQITITDKNKPEYAECPDEFTYNVGAESSPEALKLVWDKYEFQDNYDPEQDAIVIRYMGELLV